MNLFEKWGLVEDCTDADVRAAYRRFAQKMHPDRAGNTPENQTLFCLLQEEYILLKTASSRALYRHSLDKNSVPHSFHNDDTSQEFSQPSHVAAHEAIPPSVLTAEIAAPLKEIIKGGVTSFFIPVSFPCGCGRQVSCPYCRGTGQRWSKKSIRVRFPPRLAHGSTLVFPSMGHEGTWANGDLHVVVRWGQNYGWQSQGGLIEKTVYISDFFLDRGYAYVKMPHGKIGRVHFEKERVQLGAGVLAIVPVFEDINPEPFAVRIWFKKAPWWRKFQSLVQYFYAGVFRLEARQASFKK